MTHLGKHFAIAAAIICTVSSAASTPAIAFIQTTHTSMPFTREVGFITNTPAVLPASDMQFIAAFPPIAAFTPGALSLPGSTTSCPPEHAQPPRGTIFNTKTCKYEKI